MSTKTIKSPSRIGMFGGTFDPIHLGHLVLAERVRESLALDRVIFIPAAVPPHKLDWTITDSSARLAMIEQAIAGNPHFAVSDIELNRHGPSYTVDTLRALRDEFPETELFLILGADSLLDFPNWREPDEILTLAQLAVVMRPGFEVDRSRLSAELLSRVRFVEAPLIDIASRDIRRHVREGKSIRYLVPHSVVEFVQKADLYQRD